MIARKIRRLVVVRHGRAVGVLSRSDLLKSLLEALPSPDAARSDDDIFTDIIGEFAASAGRPRARSTRTSRTAW